MADSETTPEPAAASGAAPDAELDARVRSALGAQYALDRELGRGGMGIVYRATDLRLKRPVAIKLLPPELAFRTEIRTRFLREAQTAAGVNHPNIVPIYSVDERDGLVFFVMAFIDGETLGKRLAERGALPISDARRILREVADALACAHAQGVIHRDIKPDNILLERSSGRAMVSDFGIARAVGDASDSRLTATGVAIGTPTYMAPEQCAGDRSVDGRADLYSLGVVAYQMLRGAPPFAAASMPIMLMKHLTEAPVPIVERRPDVPPDLAAIVMTLLQKAPEDRFTNAGALVDALDSGIVPARPPSAGSSSSTTATRLATSPPAAGMMLTQSRNRGGALAAFGDWRERRKVESKEKDERKAAEEKKEEEEDAALPMPERIKKFRVEIAEAVGFSVFMFGVNAVTSPHFWWAAFPALMSAWAIFDRAGNLWRDGVRWGEVFGTKPSAIAQPTSAAAIPFPTGAQAASSTGPAIPETPSDNCGRALRDAASDRQVVQALMAKLGEPDRSLLPRDVVATADALVERMTALASALAQAAADVSPERIAGVEERIKLAEQREGNAAADGRGPNRALALLRRQRDMLLELEQSRQELSGHFEQAALLLQNLRLDLVKVRSAGVQSVLDDVTSATQEARALSRDIAHMLEAAAEVRSLGRDGEPRP